MTIRKFTENGVSAFSEHIRECKLRQAAGAKANPVPPTLLTDVALSTDIGIPLGSVPDRFDNKEEIGQFFHALFKDGPAAEFEHCPQVWTWLAALFFDQITRHRERFKEERAYLADFSYQSFYRHLLLGPYLIYSRAYPDIRFVRVLLYDEPTTMNEVLVQFGSYQTMMQNPELQRVIMRLYYDPKIDRIKRGAGGKGPGSPRRLMDYFRQIELNYDLRCIGEERILQMLPAEFATFLE